MEIKKEVYFLIKDVLSEFKANSEYGVYVDEIDKEKHEFGVRCFSQELNVDDAVEFAYEVENATRIAKSLNDCKFNVVSGWNVFETEEEYDNFRTDLAYCLTVDIDIKPLFEALV